MSLFLENRFYSKVEGHDPTVLLLKTADEEVCLYPSVHF